MRNKTRRDQTRRETRRDETRRDQTRRDGTRRDETRRKERDETRRHETRRDVSSPVNVGLHKVICQIHASATSNSDFCGLVAHVHCDKAQIWLSNPQFCGLAFTDMAQSPQFTEFKIQFEYLPSFEIVKLWVPSLQTWPRTHNSPSLNLDLDIYEKTPCRFPRQTSPK